jgi:hypothetical protein
MSESQVMFTMTFYLILIGVLVYWVEAPKALPINPLIKRKDPASELEDWLKKFHWGNRQQLQATGALPVYKFYTEVVEVILNLARKMGGSYQDSLLFLREGLVSDRQFEKRLKEAQLGTWLQMGLMVVLTWLFIFGALFITEIRIPFTKLLLIAGWQGLGLVCLPAILSHYRQKFFGDIGRLWKMLYVLNSLGKVPMARSEALTLAGVRELTEIRQKTLSHIVEKLRSTCERILKVGGSYEAEVKSLMEELRFQEKWHFELFEKRLTVIKLGILSLFLLPSYLVFVFLLLGDLMDLL